MRLATASLVVGSIAAAICVAVAASTSAATYSALGLIGFWLSPVVGLLAIALSLIVLADKDAVTSAKRGAVVALVLGAAPIVLFLWVVVLAFVPMQSWL
jgi:hypothetical protein